AMPEGGDLQVSTFNSPEAVHLEITDTGPGIPPGAMEAIFDPLFTTKAEGTGLGLTLTHRIISNHQGRIEVRNLPERGATFSISLPRRPETEQSLNQKEEVV
ncbi:MAG TPA: ATP-binding protein, partial [Candidatus Methylomirabilis sp.]